MASFGRDGCGVSRYRRALTPGYGGPRAPGGVSTPFPPPPLSSSVAANPIPGRAGRERVPVVLSLSFTPGQRGQRCLSPLCPHLPPNPPPWSQGSPMAWHSPSGTARPSPHSQAGCGIKPDPPALSQCRGGGGGSAVPSAQPQSPLCPVAVGGLGSCQWGPDCVSHLCVPVPLLPLIPAPHLGALQPASSARAVSYTHLTLPTRSSV